KCKCDWPNPTTSLAFELVMTRQAKAYRTSASHPSHYFRNTGPLPVHQHADPVDLRCKPGQDGNGRESDEQGKCDLPKRWCLSHDSYQHGNRRKEWNHRDPERKWRVRIAAYRKKQVEAYNQHHDNWHCCLSALLRSCHNRSNQGVHSRVHEVANQKEQREVDIEVKRYGRKP